MIHYHTDLFDHIHSNYMVLIWIFILLMNLQVFHLRIKLIIKYLIDDVDIGYDIYCTSWDMIEEDAQCGHTHLS